MTAPRRHRSVAWIYYAILAVVSLAVVPQTGGSSLVLTALLVLYATYIYRGGRIVIWFW
jgi:hypothetical protein